MGLLVFSKFLLDVYLVLNVLSFFIGGATALIIHTVKRLT